MKTILYTSLKCPKCPAFRKLLREVATELGLIEGKDFVEKMIDGENLPQSTTLNVEGDSMNIVDSLGSIRESWSVVCNPDIALEALQVQVASAPSLVIHGELIFVGEVPTKPELIKAITL